MLRSYAYYSTTLYDAINSAVSDRNTNSKSGRQYALRDQLQMPIRDLTSCVRIGVCVCFRHKRTFAKITSNIVISFSYRLSYAVSHHVLRVSPWLEYKFEYLYMYPALNEFYCVCVILGYGQTMWGFSGLSL
jgi:hypothetical protein